MGAQQNNTSDAAELAGRLARASAGAAERGLDAVVVTPGTDMTYLCGYEAIPLERLTALVLSPKSTPRMVVPLLDAPPPLPPASKTWASRSPPGRAQDPYAIVSAMLPETARVAVNEGMLARAVLGLRDAMPASEMESATAVIGEMRMRKTPLEIAALQEAVPLSTQCSRQVPGLLRPGLTEREVGARIAELILDSGHAGFVIVASGPNGASPHHEVSDRVLAVGDPVVVDIGGTMPSGYCSDSTRTYALGDPTPEYLEVFNTLVAAQAAAVTHVRPGVTCESVDGAARDVLTAAGLGDAFLHRTGHGIGLETHEEPYIVAGNTLALEPGFAFSVEPGFYLEGRYGARIEDIVVCDSGGALNCNNRPRELIIVDV